MFYSATLTNSSKSVTLNENESLHCIKVLRHQVGDEIKLFNGLGTMAIGRITIANKKHTEVEIQSAQYDSAPDYTLHIAIAPTKQNDRIEWFLEKATEFGVSEISFIATTNSERRVINIERFEKIVLAATKQSLRAYLPILNPIIPFEDFVSKHHEAKKKYIASLHPNHQKLDANSFRNAHIISVVGPEGGFTTSEIEFCLKHNFIPVSLGENRLRTETAGLFFSSLMYQQNL